MALNLPKISAPTASESSRLGGMRVAKPLVPKTYTIPTTKTAKKTASSPSIYDQFTLGDPYKASQIPGLANSSYASDVANDQKLAGMGYLTQAQRDAQAGNQASQATNIGAALAAQIAGIQGATVAQGNASGAALGAQNAATAQSGAGVAGATGTAAPAGVSSSAVNALLGTQNAATGNLYGGLEAAAYASGAQNAKQAYSNEAVNVQNDQQSQQKMLASLLSGTPSPSTREATMTTANQTADAANVQSKLSVWQALTTRATQEDALGEHLQATQDTLAANKLIAGLNQNGQNARAALSSSTSTANNAATNATSTANNKRTTSTSRQNSLTAANAKIAAAKRAASTPAARLALSKALAAVDKGAGTRVPGAIITYSVLAQPPTPTVNGKPLPGTNPPSPKSIPITAADFQSGAWKTKLPAGWKALNTPTPAKTGPTGVKNVPSGWTTYNRRLGIVKSQYPGISQGAAVQYLAQAGYKQPGKK